MPILCDIQHPDCQCQCRTLLLHLAASTTPPEMSQRHTWQRTVSVFYQVIMYLYGFIFCSGKLIRNYYSISLYLYKHVTNICTYCLVHGYVLTPQGKGFILFTIVYPSTQPVEDKYFGIQNCIHDIRCCEGEKKSKSSIEYPLCWECFTESISCNSHKNPEVGTIINPLSNRKTVIKKNVVPGPKS